MKRPVTRILLFCVLAFLMQEAFSMRLFAAAPAAVTYDSFDHQRYADDYNDLKQAFGYDKKQLWNHYLDAGFSEGRIVYLTSGALATLPAAQPGLNRSNFDYIRYAEDYQDLKQTFGYSREKLWRHFVDFGASEGRSAYIDHAEAGTNVFVNAMRKKIISRRASAVALPSFWKTKDYTDAEQAMIKQYYGTTLFIGDSVMSGFGMVCSGSTDALLKSFHFMAAPSYSLTHALNENQGGLHPPFRGQRIPPWRVVEEIRPDTVFLFMGINDIGYTPLDDMIAKYRKLVGKILEVRPGTRIIIMNVTYPYPGTKKGGLNGDNVAEYNRRLEQMAAEEGWGFMDIAATSRGEGNFMKPEYSSDRYVHVQFNVYYDWAKVIRAYAWQQIAGE